MLARVEISSATAILSPLRASVAAFWAALGVEIPSSLAEGLSSFAEVPSSLAEVNSTIVEVICTVGDVMAMIAARVGKVVVVDWCTTYFAPLKLSLTAGHKKTISAVVEATALIVNVLASGVGESYSLAGWKWS